MIKKFNFLKTLFAVAAIALIMTGCSKDDDNTPETPKDPYLSTDFSHGTYILSEGNQGNETGLLTYISDKGTVLDSVYIKVNPGHKLGNVTQSMCFYGDKAYFLSQNGELKNGGDGVIVVANLKTMKRVTAYTTSEIAITRPTHMAVVSPDKAYVRNSAGVHIVDLKARKTNGVIAGAEQANQIPLLLKGSTIYIGSQSNLLIINTNTDLVTKTSAMPGKVTNVIESKDGNLWVSCGSNIAKVSLTGEIIAQKPITGFTPNGFEAIGLCESLDGGSLFFIAGASYTPTQVCRFNFTTGVGSLFVEPAKMVENGAGDAIYGQIAINPTTGNLYVPSHGGFGALYKKNCVSTYSTSAASADKAIDRLYNYTTFCAAIYFRK